MQEERLSVEAKIEMIQVKLFSERARATALQKRCISTVSRISRATAELTALDMSYAKECQPHPQQHLVARVDERPNEGPVIFNPSSCAHVNSVSQGTTETPLSPVDLLRMDGNPFDDVAIYSDLARSMYSEHRPFQRLFQYEHCMSARAVAGGAGLELEARVNQYRTRIAQGLGCRVSDVCWLVRNERNPLITRDAAITTCLKTPGMTPS